MFGKSISFLVSLTLWVAAAIPVHADERVEQLPGYSKFSTSTEFVEFLGSAPKLIEALKKNEPLSRHIFTTPRLQQQLIKKQTTLTAIANSLQKESNAAITRAPITSATNTGKSNGQTASSIIEQAQKAVADEQAQARAHEQIQAVISTLNNTSGTESTAVAATVAATNTPLDINKKPEASGLDANGWPKHLNVPADCPAPKPGIFYHHEHRIHRHASGVDFGQAPGSGNTLNAVFEPFGVSGITFHYVMSDVEAYAVPFTTVNVAGVSYEAYTEMASPSVTPVAGSLSFQVSVAHCPYDFTNFTPAGSTSLPEACTGNKQALSGARGTMIASTLHTDDPRREIYANGHNCQLEPGTRYFYNIRPAAQVDNPTVRAGMPSCQEQYDTAPASNWQGINPKRTVNGAEHPICTTLAVFYGGYAGDNRGARKAPYAGPCLQAGVPHPLNYVSRDGYGCGEVQSPFVASMPDMRCDNPDSGAAAPTDTTCYDPANVLPPQRFTQRCSPDGRSYVWTEGFLRPAYADYICETAQAESIGAQFHVCAAHREGQLRRAECQSYGGPSAAYGYTEACQFNQQHNRYDWTVIDSPGYRPHFSSLQRCNYQTVYHSPASADSCHEEGKNHPIGTRRVVNCTRKSGVGTSSAPATRELVSTCRAHSNGNGAFDGADIRTLLGLNSLYSCNVAYHPPAE